MLLARGDLPRDSPGERTFRNPGCSAVRWSGDGCRKAAATVGRNVESLAIAPPVNCSSQVAGVVKSATYDRWFRKLKDRRARARIQVRIDRLAEGNPDDVKPVGQGVSELRIKYGPGYRVYYLTEGETLVVLLAGGNKSTQSPT